jgi:prophage regulatory protein
MRLLRGRDLYGPNGVTGMSRSTFYLAVKDGTFPAPVALGKRSVAWNSDSVEEWICSRKPKIDSSAARSG